MMKIVNNDYLKSREESNKTATTGEVTKGSSGISGFDNMNDKVKFIDPNSRNIITDNDIWENVRTEIMSDPNNKLEYDKLNESIIDPNGVIIYTSDEFLNAYNQKYKSHSAPIENVLENSAKENIKIRAALYPSRQINMMEIEGMSNLMKEGMNLKHSTKHSCNVSDKCIINSSSYPKIYKISTK